MTQALSTTVQGIGAFSEYDLDFEGTSVHCYEGGSGDWSVVLLHGSGAGAATLSNFRRVMEPLATWAHVLCADLIGFGKSGRKVDPPYFDMGLWVRQLRFLLGRAREHVICVGHSLSGAIALKASASDPRIRAVVTTGTMGWLPPTVTAEPDSAPRWNFPKGRAALRANVERTVYDPTQVEEEELDRRLAVLDSPGYPAYFETMFAGPSLTYLRESSLTVDELARIRCPVALLHGAADKWFAPEDTSVPLGRQLPTADVHIFSKCAHSVAHERPAEFLAIVRTLADRLE
jgi:2-hydroxymuconate-semialdehyde hydrolase